MLGYAQYIPPLPPPAYPLPSYSPSAHKMSSFSSIGWMGEWVEVEGEVDPLPANISPPVVVDI